LKRRDFMKLSSLAAAGTSPFARAQMQMPPGQSQEPLQPGLQTLTPLPGSEPTQATPGGSDVTLRIAPVTVELAPDRILSTIGYNGTSPGPVLRMKEGKPITVNVINETDTPELVHWHGFLIPGDVDGVEEEGTPFVPPHGSRRYSFTPGPFGSRWYHSHAMSMDDLHKGTYTGQFGFVYIDPASDPGAYDQEIFLSLRDWEPFYSNTAMDTDEQDDPNAPQPEKPKVLNTDPNGLEVTSTTYSINDKALGAGEPIRVKPGERVLFHFLNASAIENRRIALGGHKFQVIALDGNPVPTQAVVETLFLGAGERICAIVEMNNPGNWVLGAPEDDVRTAGLGILLEYANQHKKPLWIKPASLAWDYTVFGGVGGQAAAGGPIQKIDMAFEKIPGGAGKFNTFTVNGKQYPHENEFVLHEGQRYRMVFRKRPAS